MAVLAAEPLREVKLIPVTESPTLAPKQLIINPWIIALTVTLATFMELLDTSIANVALPYIGGGRAAPGGAH